MMLNALARWKVIVFGLGILASGSAVNAAVISVKAMKKNGVDVPVANQSNLNVAPNDTIQVELYISGWANAFPPNACPPTTQGLRIFDVTINGKDGYRGDPINSNGTILPVGWCASTTEISCPDTACPSEFPTCAAPESPSCRCATGHDPECATCAFMDRTRSDFILFNVPGLYPVDFTSLNYAFAGIPKNRVGILDVGTPKYLATVMLKVSPIACGTFTFDMLSDSYIQDNCSLPNIHNPTSVPLTLTVPLADCARQLLSCSPAHCFEDARIAHEPTAPPNPPSLNHNIIVMTFSKPTAGMVTTDLEATRIPLVPGDPAITIASVTPGAGGDPNKLSVTLGQRIKQQRWTCLRDKLSNKRCCNASHPGDADGNRFAQPDDTFEIFDNLQSDLGLTIEKCDTDRSTRCTSADLLWVVDLLNGAGTYDPVNGASIPLCPVSRLTPAPPP